MTHRRAAPGARYVTGMIYTSVPGSEVTWYGIYLVRVPRVPGSWYEVCMHTVTGTRSGGSRGRNPSSILASEFWDPILDSLPAQSESGGGEWQR